MKQRTGYTLTGADGTLPNAPYLGSIIENGEQLDNVVYLPNISYRIHSQYQLIEVENGKFNVMMICLLRMGDSLMVPIKREPMRVKIVKLIKS